MSDSIGIETIVGLRLQDLKGRFFEDLKITSVENMNGHGRDLLVVVRVVLAFWIGSRAVSCGHVQSGWNQG